MRESKSGTPKARRDLRSEFSAEGNDCSTSYIQMEVWSGTRWTCITNHAAKWTRLCLLLQDVTSTFEIRGMQSELDRVLHNRKKYLSSLSVFPWFFFIPQSGSALRIVYRIHLPLFMWESYSWLLCPLSKLYFFWSGGKQRKSWLSCSSLPPFLAMRVGLSFHASFRLDITSSLSGTLILSPNIDWFVDR